MENKNAKLWALLGIIAVIVIIILVAASQGAGPSKTGTSNQSAAVSNPNSSSTVADLNGAAEAPKPVIVAKDKLPKSTIKLEIGSDKITPNTFTVKAGQPVSLAVTSGDGKPHVFIFSNSVIGAIVIGVGPSETKAITFNAPVAGTYSFHDNIPGHQNVSGTMIVK